ncbi:AMP-binding protein [Nocardia australiensis]|uniref:AMP-binding protein n=1 Tax=Nocardia australiensis TaxID=2887191 RepID=UPI001D137257|nr:AMP-binding protein [Nocardia australiensis]
MPTATNRIHPPENERPGLTQSYWPADTTYEIRDITLGGLLREAAAAVPDRIAVVDAVADRSARRSWTYAEFLADAERAARALLARFEVGDRVAIMAPNSADWIVLQHGISLAGMIVVTLNPAYRAREIEYILRQSRAAGIVHVDTYRGLDIRVTIDEVRSDLPHLEHVISFSDWEQLLDSGSPGQQLPTVHPDDPFQIQYTSGTTGFPKGALLHHKGLVNQAALVAERAGMRDGGVNINAMPLYHIGGGVVCPFGALSKHGTFVVLPAFDPALMLEAVETYRGTHTLLVPTMIIALLEHPHRVSTDLSSLQTILTGAANVPAALIRRTITTLGCHTSILFGQTEMHGNISQTHLDDTPEDQSETVGRPLPHLEIKIADPGSGDVLPLGERGEICCRSYQNMIEYFDMPDATGACIDADGWLHMGDLGSMDERGFIRVTGRLKDMVIRGGLNIYPREIEELLTTHPAVADAAVVGIPDDKWGEQLAAVIRIPAGIEQPMAEELRSFCRANLSAHKTPAYWSFVTEFPLTPTGKIQKYVLQDRLRNGEIPKTTAQGQAHRPAHK